MQASAFGTSAADHHRGRDKSDSECNAQAQQRVVLDLLRDCAEGPLALVAQVFCHIAAALLEILCPLSADLRQIVYRARRLVDSRTELLNGFGRLLGTQEGPVLTVRSNHRLMLAFVFLAHRP